MNIYETLDKVRHGLDDIGANDKTVLLVDAYMKRALPLKENAVHVSTKQVMNALLHDKVTLDSFEVYNDLQELLTYFGQADLTETQKMQEEETVAVSYVDTERHPKLKKEYKQAKEKKKAKDAHKKSK